MWGKQEFWKKNPIVVLLGSCYVDMEIGKYYHEICMLSLDLNALFWIGLRIQTI